MSPDHPARSPIDDASRDPLPLARGLDAIFNRLTEALRTVEDRLRFDLSMPSLPARFRDLRREAGHLRADVEGALDAPLSLWRDVAGDVGAPAPETRRHARVRADLRDVLAANLARARESARSLEEALRSLVPRAADRATALHHAGRAEELRYGIYAAEAAAAGFARRAPRLADAQLYVLLTASLARHPILEVAEATLRGGAQVVQLREKSTPPRELLPLARALRELCAAHEALFLVNDHVDIAGLCGADGVHQGQNDLRPAEVRRLLGPDALVGVSTHSPEQARRAELDGADYIGVGPIFPTRTKEHRAAVGLEYIHLAREATALPGFAIGSVRRETLEEVIAAGAERVAICTGIIAQPTLAEVEETTRWCRGRLEGATASGAAAGRTDASP